MQNLPAKLYTANQIRQLERMLIEENLVSGFELMSRAGESVVVCVRQKLPQAKRFTIFCGAGNNAGDGFIIARLLKEAAFAVRVFILHEISGLKGDALTAYQKFHVGGGQVHLYDGRELPECDVIIDAMLGIGLTREVTGLYRTAIENINQSGVPVMAVDIPSGIHADTGKAMPIAVKANFTVTFVGIKQGLCTGDAPEYCGELLFSGLAVPENIYARIPVTLQRVAYHPMFRRHRCAHKGKHGHVLVVGGDCGFSGAVLLAGEAALRVGSGLVSVATRAVHAAVLNLHRPELMCHGIENSYQLQGLLEKASIVVLGPGLGQSPWAQELFHTVLQLDKPVVIDADGLNILAKARFDAVNKSSWILTPHPGEAARLLNCTTAMIEQDRFAAVQALQQKFGGSSVLKGAGTLIADAQGMAIVTEGNPGMASGGMGDVLSGVIAGLVAQGLLLPEAIRQGVCIHAMAADQAATEAGERGLLASDLMPHLRRLVN